MKKIKQFFNWLFGIKAKQLPHKHQFEKFFDFESDEQKTIFYRCIKCGKQKTEIL